MPAFILTKTQRELLASCIEIGLEGATQNHVFVGGENSEDDLQVIEEILEDIRESKADITSVNVSPVPNTDALVAAVTKWSSNLALVEAAHHGAALASEGDAS